jgi:hypothetical protein
MTWSWTFQGPLRKGRTMSDWNNETAEWDARKNGDYPTNRLAVCRVTG